MTSPISFWCEGRKGSCNRFARLTFKWLSWRHRADGTLQCLDTGAEFDLDESEGKGKVALAVADTLAQLLDSLVEPVVPAALHGRCAEMSSRDEAFEVTGSSHFGRVCALNPWYISSWTNSRLSTST